MVPNRHLKQARELRGWSQAKVAREIGTDATTVSRWERGLFLPTPYFRERLCALFDKNAQELGLLENARQVQESEQDAPLQPISSLPVQTGQTWQEENWSTQDVPMLFPPSWSERTDTFSYILLSAAHDQQAHRLWQDAYVRALHGQYTEARKLGEASLRAFERIGHVNAHAVREWLEQPALIPASSLSSASSSPLLNPSSEQSETFPKRALREGSIRIAFLLISSFWLLFALDVPFVR